MILGLDFGNVISKEKKLSISRDPNFMDREFVDGALASIQKLVPLFEKAYIVSKCSLISEALIPEWLNKQDFWALTGFKRENLRFCRERSEKAPICVYLGITHFIDDRVEVLSHMTSVSVKIALNPKDHEKFEPHRYGVIVAKNWGQAVEQINFGY